MTFCSVERNNLCNFGKGHHDEQSCEIIFEFGQVVQTPLTRHFLSGALTAIFSAERNQLCNFGEGHHE